MTEISVEFALAAARARTAGSSTAVRELDVETPAGPLLIGVDATQRKHLYVPVAEGEAVERHEGVALRIDERRLAGMSALRVADLYCVEPSLDPMFERLVDSMVTLISQSGPRGSAQAALHDAVALWRTLLSERSAGRESEQGLFGELHVLGLLGRPDPLSALAAWRGPDGARHDFMSEHGALEVKAAGLQAQEVPVSSIAQLDPAGSPRLGLVRVRLEERPEGLTVDGQIDRLVSAGFPRALLEAKTRSILEPNSSHLRRFTVDSVALYVVDDDFPSLRADDIPPTKRPHLTIKYSLRLEGLASTAADDGASLREFLTRRDVD